MSSRSRILAAIRRHAVPASPLPDLRGDWIHYPDRAARFSEVLSFVGGHPLRAANRTELEATVAALPQVAEARQYVCTVPELDSALARTLPRSVRVDPTQVASPAALDLVDVAIVAGEFAVAENAAVWVTEHPVTHRAVYFLAQHVVLVVSSRNLIDNMHEAYERIGRFGTGYGLFISGPSKTADIEQSLVISAHGPRSLTVVLVDE